MNDFQQGYSGLPGAQAQLMPQGFLGGLLGGPVGGLIGKGIGGLFGNPSLGSQIGQVAGGIGGSLLPFGTDPASAYLQQIQQMQQQQFAPQGAIGDFLGQFGQPIGNAIGGAFGNAQLGGAIGGLAGQLGKLLPFGTDPMAAYGQQQDFSPQNIMGIPPHIRDRILSTLPRFPGTGWPPGGLPMTGLPNIQKLLPFGVDPMMAAAYEQQLQQQQQQLAPQGFFGNLLGSVGRPLGGLIGGALGNQQLGNTIGGVAGQLGKLLPFGVDPMTAAAYEQQLQQLQQQQQQLAPQGFFGNLLGSVGRPLGGLIGGAFGNQQLGNTIGGMAGQLGKLLPFGVDPMTAAAYEQQLQQLQQQQQQLAPQGFFSNLLGSVGRPLGGLIGGAFGNQQLGNTIGGVAGQLGKLLPFGVDPMTAAAYEQQLQQQLQQQQQQLAPQGFFGNLLGSVGRPLGGLIGGAFGNQQLGGTIGGLAGQLGKMLPFGADPWSQQYAGYAGQPQGGQVMAGPFGAGQQQGGGLGMQQPTIH
ncbi:hypothetical protein [Noviherbaspirillum aridicola]|uniref:Uncharacterized protein n=1 Tax=Noviherbaspirillum aridicola TaxID=2849687 RepID=A0ABQ4PZ11_9BURK|nr:hypothetical protein [Noviherbaspirillum aridicola]GIZ50051.1 hypothetical protein NCCP691_00650 [Noviherbaspirillum aridicola]